MTTFPSLKEKKCGEEEEEEKNKTKTIRKIKQHSVCLALNIQGMNPGLSSKSSFKINLIKEEIFELTKKSIFIPFIAIVESWLKPFVMDAQLSILNYNIYRSDRKLSKNGGVLMYIHSDIVIDTSTSYDDNSCCGLICVSKKHNCFIVCMYRPPTSSEESFSNLLKFFDDFIKMSNRSNKYHIYIFGDFNFPKVPWNNLSSLKSTSTNLDNLLSFMDKHLLTQYINENTRNFNLLDLFLTNNVNFVNFIQTEEINYSDHKLLRVYNTYFSPLCKDAAPNLNNDSKGYDFSTLNLSKVEFDLVPRAL